MEALAALEQAKPRLSKKDLSELRRLATLGLYLDRVLTGNLLEGTITATALQRTSAKGLLAKLHQANDRLVVMHESSPAMLLVNLQRLSEELERVRDLSLALDRQDGPWIADKQAQETRLKELGLLP